MTVRQALQLCKRLVQAGYQADELLLDESAPDHIVVLQAEVMNSPRFLDMHYCLHSGVGMRQAYAMMSYANGLTAVNLLRAYLDPPSMDTLLAILHDYSDSVVELSTYPISVGVLGWNTLFWEVRNY
jgi:hypothetical protein